MSKKTVVILPETQRILERMGDQIKTARLRRNLATELVAERAGISRATLWSVEKGSPTVAIGTYAAVLHALGGMDKDLELVAKDDELGRKLQDLNLVTRKRAKGDKKWKHFLVKRFDRVGTQRIHYSSAMTMLGRTDGAHAADGAGYLDLVSFIRQYGAAPKKDLQELWRRIVFNMAVSNTDDHLRNHGFLLSKEGWCLSPVFDVNPDAEGDVLSLNVDETNNLIDFELAASAASMYEVPDKQVWNIINDIKATVEENWKKLASQFGITRSETEHMAPAFDMRFKG